MKKKNKNKKTANERKKEQLSDLSSPTTFAVNTREKLTYVSAYPKKFQQNITQETPRIMADIKEFKK